MKRIIIYNSQTGFTKQYAMWLAEELECATLAWQEAKERDISIYDTVIFASWLHAGSIKKLDWLKKENLGNARKIVVAVGAAPQGLTQTEEAMKNNFQKDSSEYKVFYLQGGICYEKMSLMNRMLMKVFASMMKKKKDKTPEEELMAEAIGHSYDVSKKEYLNPIIEYVRENA